MKRVVVYLYIEWVDNEDMHNVLEWLQHYYNLLKKGI